MGAANSDQAMPTAIAAERDVPFAADPHRPRYHFMPAANWLNDPNGLIQWRGVYHMFFQYNPDGAFHDAITWGHASSADLVHWTELPIALAPTPGGPDAGGCWSGCAVDDDGTPTIIYSGHVARTPATFQLPCLATGDADLVHWTKYPGNPLLAAPPDGLDVLEFRDHSVWKEADGWYMLIGSGIRDVGGTALLYRSADLRAWEYLHPLAVGDQHRREPIWIGTVWECPDFFPLGERHVLVVSAWDDRQTHYPVAMIGSYAEHRLAVEREARVDYGDSFYAPQSFTDEQGRRIMFGWLREGRDAATQRAAGWSGAMSLPRVLALAPDGSLGMAPTPELTQLRGAHTARADLAVVPGADKLLADVAGAQLEIMAEWEPGLTAAGVVVRASPDGSEATVVGYDAATQRVYIDTTRASLHVGASRTVHVGLLALEPDEPLRLQIFVDASVVEVFANGRACVTARVYPTRADSVGVGLFAQGDGATVRRLDVWQLRSI